MELGCDARGYSRAGYDKATWYCAILVGRQSVELNKMREVSKIFFQHRPFLSEVLVSFLIEFCLILQVCRPCAGYKMLCQSMTNQMRLPRIH